MLVRAVRSFGWSGRVVDLGEEFDVPPVQARAMVEGYGDCVYVEAPPAPVAAMVVSGDPAITTNDPQAVETLARKRRR